MKDKQKRDKQAIAELLREKHRLYLELKKKDEICRRLMQMVKKNIGSALDAEMLEIVSGDHFLGNQI